ncbi:hypothetical protein ZIOFF_017703 [Zingiber officinale]|uniref:Auxin-responsive protein n=1 Tax=Zingiber officinale TaxID=94328 RepID=A0A8J5H5D9_ZINOF|nr:hypothetical protein ZIOFF_017703 [Zingiber officinale]
MKVESEASGLFVKVSMDGPPYLRKIDLKVYKGYKELREGLDGMFNCFSQGELSRKEGCNGSEFAITVEEEMSRDVDRDITMPSLPSKLCTCSFFMEMAHQRLAEEATPVPVACGGGSAGCLRRDHASFSPRSAARSWPLATPVENVGAASAVVAVGPMDARVNEEETRYWSSETMAGKKRSHGREEIKKVFIQLT